MRSQVVASKSGQTASMPEVRAELASRLSQT